MRSLVCRALLLIRAATCSTRYRNVAISQVARSGSSVKPRSLDQATRSIAVITISIEPRLVGGVVVAGEVPHPGGLGLPDPVLDPGVLAVSQVQSGQLAGHHPGWGIGDEGGDPMTVDVQECQLCPGVWSFLPQDHPAPGGPFRQVQQTGGLGDPGSITDGAVGVDRRAPHVDAVQAGQPGGVGQQAQGVPDRLRGPRTRRRTRPRPHGRTSRNHRWHRRNRIGSAPRDCPGRPVVAGSSAGSTPTPR